MQLTLSFVDLLQQLAPVFTTPTSQTFVQIATGWIFSQRHHLLTTILNTLMLRIGLMPKRGLPRAIPIVADIRLLQGDVPWAIRAARTGLALS
jgi:hypothetical protein